MKEQFGPWAVVTGASSGIGEEFAHQLAASGLNLVLVARNDVLLKELGQKLQREHQIHTKEVKLDLSEPEFLISLREVTDPLDVGLVVSNAGFATMGAVLSVPLESLQQNLMLNTTAHLTLAHHFGERLLAKDRGGILFVGSTTGLQATPYAGNYAGAKAYIHGFGQAMNYELRKTGVHVSVVSPGPTRTDALKNKTDFELDRLPAPVMSTEKLVKIGLKGLRKNKPLVVAGAPNRMVDWMNRKLFGHRGGRAMLGMMMERVAPPHRTIAGRQT